MYANHKRFSTRIVPLLLGLGAIGIAMGASQASSTTQTASQSGAQPVHCEIQTDLSGGMITLQGVVHAGAATSGSYKFQVVSAGGGGNSNIRQGGNFTAGPDGAATLGKVMLGNSGATYDASLKVTSNGKTFECAERVGGAI